MINTPYISQQPVDDFGLPFSRIKRSAILDAEAETNFTVPGNSPRYKAVMRCESGGLIYVALNQMAEVPAGANFAATTSELLPTNGDEFSREVRAGDKLHFIARDTAHVSVVFYSLDTPN